MSDIKVKHLLLAFPILLLLVGQSSSLGSRIRVGKDGGYSNIVIKISQDMESTRCRDIISNIQVPIFS